VGHYLGRLLGEAGAGRYGARMRYPAYGCIEMIYVSVTTQHHSAAILGTFEEIVSAPDY
jgi:hypothetical protein